MNQEERVCVHLNVTQNKLKTYHIKTVSQITQPFSYTTHMRRCVICGAVFIICLKKIIGSFLHLLDFYGECKTLLRTDPSRCWLFVSDVARSWAGASQTCSSLGGHLAKVDNDDLHRAIIRELAEYPSASKWWIGLRNTLIHEDWWFLYWNVVCKNDNYFHWKMTEF